MSDQDRIDRLERRVASLEQLMRRMLAGNPGTAADLPEPAAPPPLVKAEVPPLTPPSPPRPAPRPSIDGEQWVGQRGLLAVGVVAVVLAAGYLLKLSFDRGWISPIARCVSGAIAGVVIGYGGWRLHLKQYRTYGASLIGTGAAVIYTAVWAASTLYGFVPPFAAIAMMAVVAFALAATAWKIDVEPLGMAAVLGAFFAPIIIGDVPTDADRLLVYLAAIGFALGTVAWSKRWRVTVLLIAVSYFGLGTVAADDANAYLTLGFGALGGAAGLALGLRYGWWETRFLSFWGGWACLALAHSETTAWLVLLAGAALSYPVWEHALRQDGVWPFEDEEKKGRGILPSIYFYTTPFWLAWAVDALGVPYITEHNGFAVAVVAAAYLIVAVAGPSRSFGLVAALGLTFAAPLEWQETLIAPGVLGVLAICFGGLGRSTRREDWNFIAFLPLVLGILLLWAGADAQRPFDSPAFVDQWALLFWGFLAVIVALATDLAAPEEDGGRMRKGVLWASGGLLLLLGVTGELPRFFQQQMMDGSAASLAGGLAVSAWWLIYAGVAVWYGFRTGIKPVRVAGLAVAGLAIMKVLFGDLRELDALYRIGSVFLLGLVSLLVAWAYHRKAREDGEGVG